MNATNNGTTQNAAIPASPRARLESIIDLVNRLIPERIHPIVTITKMAITGELANIANHIDTLVSDGAALKNQNGVLNSELERLTKELTNYRACEEIPFGAAEADPEKSQMQRRIDELEITLELTVDELAAQKKLIILLEMHTTEASKAIAATKKRWTQS